MNKYTPLKITVLVLSAILIILGMNFYFERCSPENMARNSDRCLRFFGLPNTHYTCGDEMHSQRKDCFSFGSIYYCLKGFDSKSFERLKMELHDKDADFTDSIATLRLQRNNIDGTFRLFLYGAPYQAIISFEETGD